MTVQLAKGVKDYNFKEMIKRQELIEKLKNVFERFGFSPFESPIIERFDVLSSKFGAGADSDAMIETFKLSDQGGRELGLRFELTLSMCRFIAMNPTIKLPFKRYEIGRVYRDGPIKLGRMREFTQCDVDIVGAKNMVADAEILRLGLDAISDIGLDAYILVNNRKILRGLLEFAGIGDDKKVPAIIIIDKLDKIGRLEVSRELEALGISSDKSAKLLDIISFKGSFEDTIARLKKSITDDEGIEGINEVEELFSYFSDDDRKNIIFNASLARGLSYYTGTIFEGYLRNSKVTSAICGGGRYDKLISSLMNTNNEYPAIGISFGLVPILEALNLEEKSIDDREVVSQVFILPIGDVVKEAMVVASKMRANGINAESDLMLRPLSKNLKYANSQKIPFVLFVGENELKENKFKLKNMVSGDEFTLSLDDAVLKIKESLN
ncbi:MAG: histidine--tRNA ligase [Candidatus Woesearchaeota archaeon]